MELPETYIPIDRRLALAEGEQLPDRSSGAALFADISGFTPLTETLTKELGPQRGAEELSKQLIVIYTALIAQVDRYRGSVISFSGDAITCWLDGDNGRRAIACALAIQQAMRSFSTIETPSGASVPLAIKVAVAAGPVRRFLIGDPLIQLIDVLAGATLDWLSAAEHLASKGEIVAGAAARIGRHHRHADRQQPRPNAHRLVWRANAPHLRRARRRREHGRAADEQGRAGADSDQPDDRRRGVAPICPALCRGNQPQGQAGAGASVGGARPAAAIHATPGNAVHQPTGRPRSRAHTDDTTA